MLGGEERRERCGGGGGDSVRCFSGVAQWCGAVVVRVRGVVVVVVHGLDS